MLDQESPVYPTRDSITATTPTVFSGAVPLAVSLAFILTSIGYFTTKSAIKPPYFPKVFVVALKHSVYSFCLVAIAGLLIQRYLVQIEVSAIAAAAVAGVIASNVATVVDYETKKMLS